MNDILKEKTSTMQITSIRDDIEERIDLRTGRLVLDYTDFEWGGELMPVSIHHVYNSSLSDARYTRSSDLAVADFSAMNLGLGWKLNIMQSMVPVTENGVTKYYYTDGEGNTTEFSASEEENIFNSVNDKEVVYNSETRELTSANYVYSFDVNSYLTKITDTDRNVAMDINYNISKIVSVKDGAQRIFTFTYDEDGFLSKITAPDKSYVSYVYSGDLMTDIVFYGSVKDSNGNYTVNEYFHKMAVYIMTLPRLSLINLF